MSFEILEDKMVFGPSDIPKGFRPVGRKLNDETHIMAAFNPGMTRLASGNILLMVRVAETLSSPVSGERVYSIRWDKNKGYTKDGFPIKKAIMKDPRGFKIKLFNNTKATRLTSLSWLLPVELGPSGMEVKKIHYDKIIQPQTSYQEFGIEDPRITKIEGSYYMTAVCVSSERLCTCLYKSDNGLDYDMKGIIFDHQNKDAVLLPEKVSGKYYAITRPSGLDFFAPSIESDIVAGTTINLAESPDMMHWKPTDKPLICMKNGTKVNKRLGAGAPPIIFSDDELLFLFHGVEHKPKNLTGIYRTFYALLDRKNPARIRHIDMVNPVLEANPSFDGEIEGKAYLNGVVFTTGLVPDKDSYILASGEIDLACRITRISKNSFKFV